MYRIQIENEQDDNQGHLIDGMDNVSTKIKALPKDQIHKASAEVEIGEYIMNPNTLSLHKALGKRHSKGGTPVNIPDNSFIFSDFKDLGFNKNDKERFEFKLGGTKLKNNTPAKVLEKNIDIKHHNKMINILNSNSQDDIAKNSAELMLTKNLNTIGKVAYVQEGKKGFPQGIPPFSQGTAPVYKKEVDDDITQSVQYMKHGGSVIPKYQLGKYNWNGTPIDNPVFNTTVPLNTTNLDAGELKNPYVNQFRPVGLTPWQNFNMALPLINKLGIKSQYPLYQQQRSISPEQTLMSADPYLNQTGMDYNQAANINRALNPLQAYANNSELYSKKLDANNQALNQINQGNTQIQNNQNQLAAQTYNGDMMNNLKFNKQYYDELSTTNQNKERYKDFYNNQFITNANQMIAENQAFNNLLGSQQTFDGKPLYSPVSNGFGYSMQLTPGLNPDILFDQQFGTKGGNKNLYQSLLEQYNNETDPNKIKALGYRLAGIEKAMYAPKAQKGGFIPKFKL